MLLTTIYLASIIAFGVCTLVWLINMQIFVKESNYVGRYYMPTDRLKRIRVFFILSAVFLLIERFSGWIFGDVVSTILFIALGLFVGWTLGMFFTLHKANNWTRKATPSKFTMTLFYTAIAFIVYLGYNAYHIFTVLIPILQHSSSTLTL